MDTENEKAIEKHLEKLRRDDCMQTYGYMPGETFSSRWSKDGLELVVVLVFNTVLSLIGAYLARIAYTNELVLGTWGVLAICVSIIPILVIGTASLKDMFLRFLGDMLDFWNVWEIIDSMDSARANATMFAFLYKVGVCSAFFFFFVS